VKIVVDDRRSAADRGLPSTEAAVDDRAAELVAFIG
jgi:hypothetical protein